MLLGLDTERIYIFLSGWNKKYPSMYLDKQHNHFLHK